MRLVAIVLYLVPFIVSAYEVETHQLLSTEALKASVLADPSQNVLINLGLRSELYNGNIQEFTNNDPNEDNKELSIDDLIRFGAELEDDLSTERSLHHFYDPAIIRPLDMPGLSLFRDPQTSPDWAVEDITDIPAQAYSYKDATNYFYLALTSQTELERNTNWGLMFQSLGQVIHHIQDMSQPDHVRNDAHCNLGVWDCVFRHDPSVYEKYTKKSISLTIPSYITLDYPIPAFPTAREFWTTPDDKGIADFTNLNFFSKDTNFQYNNGAISPSAEYPAGPIPNLSPISRNISDVDLLGATRGQALCDELKTAYTLSNPAVGDCYIDFIQTTVTDVVNPDLSSNNQKAASLSIFDDELVTYNSTILFEEDDGDIVSIDRRPSLNEFNFKAAHQYLIPRAVAYSAGLINHFFKAKFEVTVDHINKAFVIKNLSGSVMHGQFKLYTETVDTGLRGLNQEWSISDYAATGLANNAVISIAAPSLTQFSNELIFIYRGNLGEGGALESVSGYALTLKDKAAGYRSVTGVHEVINNYSVSTFDINIKTYIHNELEIQEFSTNIIQTESTEFRESRYQVTEFHWAISAPGAFCYVQAVGDWDAYGFMGDFYQDFTFGFRDWFLGVYFTLVGLPTTFVDTFGIVAPTVADCAAAPYGHKSVLWSNGWISKYSLKKYFSGQGVNTLGFTVVSPSVYLNTYGKTKVLDSGVCRNATIQDIKSTWTPNFEEYKHTFSSAEDFTNDDPISYLNSYIPQNIIDYSCW